MGIGTNLLLLLFSLSFVLYLFGYQSGFQMMLNSWGGGGIGTDTLITSLIISLIAGFTGAAITAGVSSRVVGSTYSVIYTIPAGFITAFLGSFMLMPMSFLFEPAMPDVLKYFLGGFLYITLVATIVSFIRGGEF